MTRIEPAANASGGVGRSQLGKVQLLFMKVGNVTQRQRFTKDTKPNGALNSQNGRPTMTDPHEIIEAALADAHDIGMTDALYSKAIVRALEARFVIVDPDNVTEKMVRAFVVAQTLDKPWAQMLKDQIVAAIRAAHKWSKG